MPPIGSSPDAAVPDVPPAQLLQAEVSELAESSASISGVDGKKVIYAIVSLKAYCTTMEKTDMYDAMKSQKSVSAVLELCGRLAAKPKAKDIGDTPLPLCAAPLSASSACVSHRPRCDSALSD